MSEGRPNYHIPASWLTVKRPNGTVDFYRLSEDGSLVLINGQIAPLFKLSTSNTSQHTHIPTSLSDAV